MLVAASLIVATLTLTDRRAVTLAAPMVRIGDVASGAGPVARAVIARLPRGHSGVMLSRRAIAALIRRAVPGVTVAGADRSGAITLTVPMAKPRVAFCMATRAPVAAGAAILTDLVAAAPCDGPAAPGLVAYDRARGEVVARRSIAADVNLGMMRLPERSAVRTGDRLTLVSRAGPVTVERGVTAMQPGRDGRRIFVRDGAGKVSSITLAVASK